MKTLHLKTQSSQQGVTSVALIVAITLVLVSIIIAIQVATLLSIRISQAQIAEKQAGYLAESIIYDSLIRMSSSNYSWPPNPANYDTPFTWNKTKLNRTITKNSTGYLVDITATNSLSSRRLQAKIDSQNAAAGPVDIVLIMDTSGSMQDGGCAQGACEPYTTAIASAATFIDYLIADPNFGPVSRSGLITFSTQAKEIQPLTSQHSQTRDAITNRTPNPNGYTNIHDALRLAEQQHTSNPNPLAKKFIIMLTDGLPTVHTPNGTVCGDGFNPNSTNACTDDALNQALSIKSNNIELFIIGLGLSQPSPPMLTQQHINLAKSLINQMVSTPNTTHAFFLPPQSLWNNNQLLDGVYLQILGSIRAGGTSLQIQEYAP